MKRLLPFLNQLYAGLLRFYPGSFRVMFCAEMQTVFYHLSAQAAEAGGLALTRVFFRELKDLPLAALREHWRARKELSSMRSPTPVLTEKPTPRWAVIAIICLFVLPGLFSLIRVPMPEVLGGIMAVLVILLLVFVPLGVGLVTRLPRWSLLYFGAVTSVGGVYIIFMSLERLFEPTLLAWMGQVIGNGDLFARLVWLWMNQGRYWFSILLANALFIGLAALLPWFRPQLRWFWRDLTMLSFLFYGGILIIFFIDFDEYRYDELYQLGCMTFLAAGAWGYLRAKTPGWRTLALVAGLTGCMAVMGVGKYFLVPQQNWAEWFDRYPVESERWFESLRTIATWFWPALVVGLPGLLQAMRKGPAAIPEVAGTAG